MKKVLVLFHPLNDVFKYLEEEGGNQFAPHHFWFFDKLKEAGYEVDFVKSNDQTWLNKLGNKLRLNFLQQQLDALKMAKNYDLIFVPYIEFAFFLAILKRFQVFKKPLVGFAHKPYFQSNKSLLKKAYYDTVRSIYFQGIDSVLFYSQPVLENSRKGEIMDNIRFVDNYGIDFDFFEAYSEQQKTPPKSDYIYSTGGSKRDFDTLIKAFYDIDFNLKITTVGGDLTQHLSCEPSANVLIDNSLPFGLGSTGKLRSDYYNALAVAVPLKEVDEYLFATWGITVVMEGMAMGKPIVSTYNRAYPFNLEKEKIGFYVDYGDVQGWKDAINYLLDHPEERLEMGERARHLCKTKYNYGLFAKNVVSEVDRVLGVDTQDRKQNRPEIIPRTVKFGVFNPFF